MAIVNIYRPDDPFPDRFVYAVRHYGPTKETPLGSGRTMGRRATHVRHLLRELAVYADWETGDCFPEQETLARALCIARPSVSGAVSAAVAAGWLAVRKRPAPGRKGRDWGGNLYRLQIPAEVQAELDAENRARQENGRAGRGGSKGRMPPAPDARQKSRRAREDARQLNPRARQENGLERVSFPDTNLSVEPSREQDAHARERLPTRPPPPTPEPDADGLISLRRPGILTGILRPRPAPTEGQENAA